MNEGMTLGRPSLKKTVPFNTQIMYRGCFYYNKNVNDHGDYDYFVHII